MSPASETVILDGIDAANGNHNGGNILIGPDGKLWAAPTALGNLTFYPAGTPTPLVSTINYRPGQTRASNAVLSLGANGDFNVLCIQASGTVQFILDLNGYFQ